MVSHVLLLLQHQLVYHYVFEFDILINFNAMGEQEMYDLSKHHKPLVISFEARFLLTNTHFR